MDKVRGYGRRMWFGVGKDVSVAGVVASDHDLETFRLQQAESISKRQLAPRGGIQTAKQNNYLGLRALLTGK